MNCSQLLSAIVSFGVVVLVYLITSAHCYIFLTEARHNLTMGVLGHNDLVLCKQEIKIDNLIHNESIYHFFVFPDHQDLVKYKITYFKVEDKGKEGYVYLYDYDKNSDFKGYGKIVFYLESQVGKGLDYLIEIFGERRNFYPHTIIY